MLSADMMRYVELHRTAGFKFRTQYEMLARFVIFAESMQINIFRSSEINLDALEFLPIGPIPIQRWIKIMRPPSFDLWPIFLKRP